MQPIQEPTHYRFSFHHLGFRPFFLLAGTFAVFSTTLWFFFYQTGTTELPGTPMPTMLWHAHEMIYGYALAVIAGFILTAVRNWTGVQTLHGAALIVLALLWLCARILPFVDNRGAFAAMAILDISFNLLLCLAVLHPIVKSKQWNQFGVWSKLIFLLAGNVLFYLGLFGTLQNGIHLGLYTGLYIVVSLLLLMARRVIPFFIEKGVDSPVTLINYRWLDLSSLVLMLVFLVVEVFYPLPKIAGVTAAALFILHAWRLRGWYTPGIWKKPLLWSLFLAYSWITLGFGMLALSRIIALNPMLAVHAFAYGGVGLMTLGMMARVVLGHTGRNVFEPPQQINWMFGALFLGSLARVFGPIFLPDWYGFWIGASQVLWIAAFTLFCWVYVPMLIMARVDGQYG